MMTIDNTPDERLDALFAGQKRFFRTGATLDPAFRYMPYRHFKLLKRMV